MVTAKYPVGISALGILTLFCWLLLTLSKILLFTSNREVGTMRTFILFWFDGTTNEVVGYDFRSACARNGYGSAFLQALDFYREKK